MRNLSELILDQAERRPDAAFGVASAPMSLGQAVGLGLDAGGHFAAAGVKPGDRVALIGPTSNSWLVAWLGLVLSGTEVALVNPDYPAELLQKMLDNLEPKALVWVGREPHPNVATGALHLDAGALVDGVLLQVTGAPGDDASDRSPQAVRVQGERPLDVPGLCRGSHDTAGFMHTSGTTGVPKFCEQSHEYFLRLGRFIADSMCLCETDTVLAPLPMFHINPLGYGVIGGLTGGAGILGLERFSASGFWTTVKQAGATVLILHAPPIEILKRATTGADAAGHQVSRMFFADADFLETFNIPLGFSAYGSTEAGGLCHIFAWRRGERPDLAEGMSRYGGRARHDVQWRVDDTGEIFVRAAGGRAGVLFEGYRRGPELVRPFDNDGWFPTGDLGRVDDAGNLVFIERRSESIRVKGEFVPIGYVEQRFATVEGVADAAVWRRSSQLVDDEIVLYITTEDHMDEAPGATLIPVDAVREVCGQLPGFMRPAAVVRVGEIPRDSGVGKVRRRLLADEIALEVVEL